MIERVGPPGTALGIGFSGHDSSVLTAVMVALLAACSSKSDKADIPLQWTFTQTWSVGGADDHVVSLSDVYPFQVKVGTADRIFLLAAKERRVYVLSPSGELLDSLGTSGTGPGEFTAPYALDLDDDNSISVVDLGNRRIIRWGQDGKLLDPVPITDRVDHPQMAVRGDTAWFTTVASVSEDRAEYQLIARLGSDKRVLARLERQPRRVGDFPMCNATEISVQPLFAPTIHWARNGRMTAVNAGADYRIDILLGDSVWRTVRRETDAPQATQADAEYEARHWLLNDCLVPPEAVISVAGFMASVPQIEEVSLARDGALWVRRKARLGHPARIDVFAPGGAYSGTLPEGSPFPAAFLLDGRIVALEKDSLDLPTVTVYSVSREGGRR